MFNQLIDSSFWFSVPTLALTSADKAFFYFFCALVAIGVIAGVFMYYNENKGYDMIAKKIRSLGLYIGLFGVFWFWLRYENIQIFSSRYWAGLLILIWLYMTGRIIKFACVDFKKIRAQWQQQELKEKYLNKR